MSIPGQGSTQAFPAILDLTRICHEFESAWRQGSRPDPTPFVAKLAAEEQQRGLLSLLSIEFVERRRRGESPAASEYLGRFPQFEGWLQAMLPALPVAHDPSGSTEAGTSKAPLSPGSGGSSTDPAVDDHEADPADLVGRTLGDYELVEQIGRGGMGVIYRARQLSLNRWVALKVIRWGQHAGRVDIRRFLVEAEAAAGLDHPNIVPIFDIGRGGSIRYYTMKLVEGGNLASRSRQYRGDLPRACALISKVARAVQHAHSRGILHRDLKPSNILISDHDEPLVSDFGLAKRIGGESDLTLSGTIVGSPHYMAPEQAEGRLRDLSTASDVYSIGAILFELTTGRPPFVGATEFETLEAVILRPPPRPSALNARIDRDLETIILKCLMKEQLSRYHTAEALGDDLDRWRVGEPIEARPIPLPQRLMRWGRRQPALALLSLALVATGATGMLGIIWQWRQAIASEAHAREAEGRAQDARHDAEQRRLESEKRRQEAEIDRNRLRRQLYLADMLLAAQDWQGGQIIEMLRTLTDNGPKPGQDDLQGFEWHYLRWLPESNQATLGDHNGPVVAVAQDPKRDWFATAGHDGAVRVWVAGSYQVVHRLNAEGPVYALAYSPDGRWLAAGGAGGRVHLWDAETGQPGPAVPESDGIIHALAFHPDNRTLAIAGYGKGVRLWDIVTQSPREEFPGRGLPFFAVEFSPDGRHLVAGDGAVIGEQADEGTIFVWDREAGPDAPARKLQGHNLRVTALSFSPDGTHLASASCDRTVCIWDFATDTVIRTLRGHTGEVRGVDYSPDGKFVATVGMDRSVRVWEVETTRAVETWYGHRSTTTGVAWWRDGNRLTTVSLDSAVRIWDLREEAGRKRLWAHEKDWATTVAFSPDGLRVASGGDDDRVIVGSARGDAPPAVLVGHTADIRQVAFSPDGKELASASDDATVIIWNPATKTKILTWRHSAPVTSVAYSPDGRRIIIGTAGGSIFLRERATGAQIGSGPYQAGAAIARAEFHPSGRGWGVATTEGHLLEWPDADGSPREVAIDPRPIEAHGDYSPGEPILRSIAYSPDGRWIAGALSNGDICLWQSGTLSLVYQLHAHSESTRDVAFSPSSDRLASSSQDGSIKIWDVATGQEALNLRHPSGFAQGLAFRSDGRALATAGSDYVIRNWGPPPQDRLQGERP